MRLTTKAALLSLLIATLSWRSAARLGTRANIHILESGPRTVLVGDFNGDGILDAATIGSVVEVGKAQILLGNGDGRLPGGARVFLRIRTVLRRHSRPQTKRRARPDSLRRWKRRHLRSVGQWRRHVPAEFAVTSACAERFAPSANCTISVTFSPTKEGYEEGTITIIDSASSKPEVIEVLGTGT